MKIYLLLFLLFLPIVNAQEVDFKIYNENYHAGETFQAEILFNQLPLNNFEITKVHLIDNSSNEIKIAPFMYKIKENKYFIYFDLPEEIEGNLKLEVRDLLYKEENLKQKSFSKDFFAEKDDNVLSIKPGFFFEGNLIELEAKSKKGNNKISFESNDKISHVYYNEQEILEGRSRYFNFKLKQTLDDDIFIKITYGNRSYSIPIFAKEIVYNEENISIPFEVENNIKRIAKTLDKQESVEGDLKIKNLAGKEIEIEFVLDESLMGIVEMNYSKVKIQTNETLTQYFWINRENVFESGNYEGNLTIKYLNYMQNIEMQFAFEEKQEDNQNYAEDFKNDIFDKKNDSEAIDGIDFFQEGEIYQEEEKQGGIGTLSLTILVIIAAFIFYLFTRKKQRHQKFDEYLKGIEKK